MKLATIGTGSIVELALNSMDDVEDVTFVACYSRNMVKAMEFGVKFGFERAYDNLEFTLEDPDVDTVYIASPNSLHVPQAIMALEHGKNVILEKPFAATVQQAEELFALAESKGLMIFEAITSIHTPNYGLLKDQITRVGNVKQIIMNFSQYSSRYNDYKQGKVTNVFDPVMEGGALPDINIYNIHFVVSLYGMPLKTTYYPVLGFNGIDTSGVLILQYPDFVATCIGAKDSSSPYLFFVQGDEGTFTISGGSSGKMTDVFYAPCYRPGQVIENEKISIDQGPHMTFEFMDFSVAIREHNLEMYEAWKKETLDVMKILEEALSQRDAIAKSRAE